MRQARQLIILTPGFPADELDTSCISTLQDFVLGWQTSFPEIKIDIITFQYPRQSKKYRWHNLQVYAAGGKDRGGIYRITVWLKVFRYLLQIRQDKQAVVLSYFLTEATLIGWLFSKVSSVQLIAVAAGQDVTKENKYLRWLAAVTVSIVVFNDKMKEALKTASGIKTRAVIPMGVHHIVLPGSGVSRRDIDVLFAGSLIPVKQPALAIRIISEVKHEFKSLHVEIAGDGSERAHLEQLISELGLTDVITINGQLRREAVIEKMKRAKILLHTSFFEGQPAVITEALQAGMYVVCFDIGRISNHPKVHVCSHRAAMVHALREILHHPQPDFSPVSLPGMSHSVMHYNQIFKHPFPVR